MGLPYLLGVVQCLHYFPPFTLEIFVVAVLILLLACPLSLAEYYNFTNEDANIECHSPTLTRDDVVGEPSVIKKTRPRRASIHSISPKCNVPKVLRHTSSLIKSIGLTLKNIDKTNNDIIVNNLDISNQISDTTFIRAFQLEEYKHDSHVVEECVVDLGEIGTEPLPDVDASVDTRIPNGHDVDSEDSNVSNGSDISADSDEHSSSVYDSDEEEEHDVTDDVSVVVSSDSRQTIALRRTDEITNLSGTLVPSPHEVVDVATTPLAKEVSLTDLILDDKLDLSMIRDRSKGSKQEDGNTGEDAESVSSESDSNDDDLFLERRQKLDDGENDLGLLENILNNPCNSERQRRSLDSLQEEADYQDLDNISNEDLESNKQFFVNQFINDEEIKNHSRFKRSKRKIFIEEIPISDETEDSESVGILNTLIESDLEAENQYFNPKFNTNDFSSSSDVQICTVGNDVFEEGNISGSCVLSIGRPGMCEYDVLPKVSEENFPPKQTARYKSFSTFSDFKKKTPVFEELHANSETIIGDDIFLKRYEAILDYAVNAHDTSTTSNPFLSVITGPMQDIYLNKLIKGEESDVLDSKKTQKLHDIKQCSAVGVVDVSAPIPIPMLNTQHAHSGLSTKNASLEKDGNDAAINKEIDLNKMSSRCRLIFGYQKRAIISKENVSRKTGGENTSAGNSSSISEDNSFWKFRENVKAKKIVFDKDTFLRRREPSFHVCDTNSGSMNNLLEISNSPFMYNANNNMYDVHSQESCGKDDVAGTSYAECFKIEESDCEDEPSTSTKVKKLRSSRTSMPKFKLLLFKTKSREKSSSDTSQKLSGKDLTERLSISKSKSKTSKRSKVFNKNENVVSSKEDQSGSVEEDGARVGTSKRLDEEYEDILDNNTFTKLFHRITRKLKGNNNSKAAATTMTTTRGTNDKNTTVQNKLYVYKGNKGVVAFPAEDPLEVDRNLRSLDYFYSELQSDHHSLKITSNKINIPASGSSTDANTSLHLAPLMELNDE